jgi:hypothetical protein
MKKYLIILSFLLLLIISPAFADDITFKMTAFTGGSINLNVGFDSDALYGARGDALRMGGAQSTLDFNTSFTSYNPACLSFLNTAVVSLDLIPVPVLSSRIVEKFLSNDSGTSIKNFLNDNLLSPSDSSNSVFNNFNPQPGVKTKLDSVGAVLEQQSGFTGFEIMVPFAKNQASIAFARENKFSMDLSAIQSGMNTAVEIGSNLYPTTLVDVNASVDSSAQVHLENIVTSIGIGRKFTPEWGVGAVLEHYDSDIKGDVKADITATAYNTITSSDIGIGDLSQWGYGEVYGEGWGLRFGTSYHFLKDTLELGADFSIEPEIKYTGSATAINNIVDTAIDPNATSIPTDKRVSTESGTLKVKLPSFMRLTFAYKPGMVLDFNYTHYFDSFALKYSSPTRPDLAGEYYMDMMDDIRIGLNFGYFQIGGGAIYSKVYSVSKGVIKNTSWFAIPAFSTGFVVPFGDYLKWEVEILASPLPTAKTAITYYF